jgi:hypothetical protein
VPEADAGWLVDEDWFAEAEAEGWLVDADWFAEAEAEGWLADADWFAEAEADGWLAEAEDEENGLEPEAEAEAPAAASRPGMSAPADFACAIAAWVCGPMTPSTGPGSKPLSFSACWSWRTDSSPADWLAPAVAPCDEALSLEADMPLEADVSLEADMPLEELAEGWFAEAEVPALCADCDCVALAPWWVEAEEDEGWLFAAIAVPAAMSAATRASFFISMCLILSSMKATRDTVTGKMPAMRADITPRQPRGARYPCVRASDHAPARAMVLVEGG